jgi:SAM-dependent methyltransferase
MNARDYVSGKFLHLICRQRSYQDYSDLNIAVDGDDYFQLGFASSIEFFKRYQGHVDFKDKTVLDVGCGLGSTCFYLLQNGAASVVGTDINNDRVNFAKSKICESRGYEGKIEFKLLHELGDLQFDIVLSKDSFEHYDNPEEFILFLMEHTKPGGKIVIGFSPLWDSPYGGHLGFLSRWPWIHILFPESAVMAELRRYYKDEGIQSYKNIAGGLNKMSARQFMGIVKKHKLKINYLKMNVSSETKIRCLMQLFNFLRSIPGLQEYFTVNIYSIFEI